jgi:hypothetical protein
MKAMLCDALKGSRSNCPCNQGAKIMLAIDDDDDETTRTTRRRRNDLTRRDRKQKKMTVTG